MNQSNITRALSAYDISYKRIRPVQSGYRNYIYPVELNDGTLINLLIYKAESGIKKKMLTANVVTEHLAKSGLPVRRQIDKRIIKLTGKHSYSYGCLYNYLPGNTISWEAYTMSHIKLIGKTLALIHKASNDLKISTAPNQDDIVSSQTNRMVEYFSQPGVIKAIGSKLKLKINTNQLTKINEEITKPADNEQILHMDFVRGNILFDTASNYPGSNLTERNIAVSGIIDFEKVSNGSRLHDIARTLAFLLVDCKYKQASKIVKYFLESGYIKRGGEQIESRSKLDSYLYFYLSYDFYKFLLHSPYEFLEQNEHYLRTKNILLKAGILETAWKLA